MKSATTILAAIVGMAGLAVAQGVTSAIAPEATAPAGCSASYDGTFEITVAKVYGAAKRDEPIAKRDACSGDGILVSTLSDGTLLDAQGRTGYIASNYQFQYDKPAQAGAIYTSGFSACANGSLALGGSAVFYECESGDFFNLYDRDWAAQCSAVEILIMPCGGTASETGDGQVVGTQIVTTTIVSALSDGQPQVKTATTGIPLCQVSQISDGQVQVGTTPCASITSTAAAATTTLVPVSQYSDGQIQVTPAASVPTVTSAPAATTTAAASGTTAAGGSSVVLPSETHASGTAATSAGSTLATSKASTSGSGTAAASSSAASSAAASGTSAPASSGAADLKMPSVVALMVVLGGAVALF